MQPHQPPIQPSVLLSNLIGRSFFTVHCALVDAKYDSYWLRGGRGSLKSSFVAIEILLGLIEDPTVNAVCVRKVGDTIRTSVLASFIWAIDKLELSHLFKVIHAPAEITYLPTGQQIIMKGLDDPQKLKSIRAKRGYFKYLWFEEGSEFTDLDEMQSVIQSVLRGGEKFVEFVTYNPPAEPFSWINEEARVKNPRRWVHESNYKQVNPAWLGPKFLEDAAQMEREKPEKFAHVYMGVEVGRTDAIVFSGCYRIEAFDTHPDWDGPYLGADFGFSQDPNTLVELWIKDRTLYIKEEVGGVGIMLDDMPKLYEKIPSSRRYKIRGDCSRPETIAHIKSRGFNIEAAEKWQGSVEDGLTVMKSYQIVVHPRCVETIKEMRMYSYKIDKITRDVLPDLVDKYNHYIDACRYALAPFIKQKQGWFV